MKIRRHADRVREQATCDSCGGLRLSRSGQTFEAAARAHLREHPDHDVWVTRETQVHFFADASVKT